MSGAWGLFPYETIDYKAAQAWLEKRGAAGLRLNGIYLRTLARFRREDAPVHYFVDVDCGEGEDYLRLCADAGWEPVADVRGMTVFVSRPGERPVPIQTDPAMEGRRFLRRYLLKNVLLTLGLLLAVAALAAGLALLGPGGTNWTELFLMNSNLLLPVWLLVAVAALAWDIPATILCWRRVRRAAAAGEEAPVPGAFRSRLRGILGLLPQVLWLLYLLATLVELLLGLGGGRQTELPEGAPRAVYQSCPILMPEDMGVEPEGWVHLRRNRSFLVPELIQYTELVRGEEQTQIFETDRYRCRWEWTARLLLQALRADSAAGRSGTLAGKLEFVPVDMEFDEAYATEEGHYLLLRQGAVVVLLHGGDTQLTDPGVRTQLERVLTGGNRG